MPKLRRHLVVPLLCAAAVVAGVLVHVACRPRPPQPPADAAALLERLRPLGLHVVPSYENGDWRGGVYLCETERPRSELLSLPRVSERIGAWSGVVLVDEAKPTWEDAEDRVGPLRLFGDPELVSKIREALAA